MCFGALGLVVGGAEEETLRRRAESLPPPAAADGFHQFSNEKRENLQSDSNVSRSVYYV